MPASAPNPMATLFRRLRKLGLSRDYVREKALPDWWDDRIAKNPSGYAEGLMFISRHIGLDFQTLLDPAKPVEFKYIAPCKFKSPKGSEVSRFALTQAIATRVAQFVIAAFPEPVAAPPMTAREIRETLLHSGQGSVNLPNLLDYCWAVGIPVVHLWGLPLEARRPDGLAVKIRGKPVIILCKRDRFPAWLLFILAHELGHIILGHVSDDQVLLDQSLKDNENDCEETAANAFAIELLTGDPNRRFGQPGRRMNTDSLVRLARERGASCKVDPGHVALNYAFSTGGEIAWALADSALGTLEPKRDGLEHVRRRVLDKLDWDGLPEASPNLLFGRPFPFRSLVSIPVIIAGLLM